MIRRLIDDKSAPSPSGVGEPDRPAQRLTPADIDEIVNAVERRVLAQLDRRGLRGGR